MNKLKEDSDEVQKVLSEYCPPSLERNILTESGKRWQLWGKGIKGKEAEKIIKELYPNGDLNA